MKKKIREFSYDKNIANVEAFCWDKYFSKNLLFLRSELLLHFLESDSYHDQVLSLDLGKEGRINDDLRQRKFCLFGRLEKFEF